MTSDARILIYDAYMTAIDGLVGCQENHPEKFPTLLEKVNQMLADELAGSMLGIESTLLVSVCQYCPQTDSENNNSGLRSFLAYQILSGDSLQWLEKFFVSGDLLDMDSRRLDDDDVLQISDMRGSLAEITHGRDSAGFLKELSKLQRLWEGRQRATMWYRDNMY